MTATRPRPRRDTEWMQRTALLRATLTTMARYNQQMQDDLDNGELNIAHADQLGRSVLVALREAAAISARAEDAAKASRGTAA